MDPVGALLRSCHKFTMGEFFRECRSTCECEITNDSSAVPSNSAIILANDNSPISPAATLPGSKPIEIQPFQPKPPHRECHGYAMRYSIADLHGRYLFFPQRKPTIFSLHCEKSRILGDASDVSPRNLLFPVGTGTIPRVSGGGSEAEHAEAMSV